MAMMYVQWFDEVKLTMVLVCNSSFCHRTERNTDRGASIATPDKVGNTLALFKPTATQVDLDAFVAAAIRGRSNTAFAAITFISIQILAFGTLFVGPGLKMFFNVDF